MVKFILKRIGTMIIAMFMIILITFTLMHAIPGGPFTNTKGVPEEVTQAMEAKYGLDQPMPVQFVKYLGNLLHGDFGPSYKYTGKTVNDFIATGAPVSAKLGLVTLVFVLLTSIPMGILAALKNGKWQDMLLMAIATIGVTIPSFVIASMLIYVFSFKLNVLPTFGLDSWKSYILPVIAMGGYSVSYLARLMRSSLLEVMGQDYIRTARAKGLTEFAVVTKHALRKTLEITLIQPTSYFIDILSMWTFSPVQKATVEANGDKWSTEADTYICNGPFKIASMSMNENVILEKNENYWDAENVSLQKVTFRYVLDQATALTAYESGEVDGVASIPSSDFARLKAENAGVQTSPSYGTVYYDFNCSAEPVNNVLVRKAICLAIDRQSIIDNVVQVDAQPAYSFLAPGYSVDGKDITEGRESFGLSATADVEGAQAALAEAGYPNGEGFPTLTLSYYDNDTVKKVVEAMAEMLKNNLNINVEVSSNEWSIFYDDVQKGNYQVAAMGWSADYVNPMSFLPLCKTGDSSNNLFYSNADYDALVDQVKAENDPAKAAELTLQADAIVSNDYAVLPLYYKSNNYLMHDNISGFYMTASGNLFFKDVKVG